MPRGRKPKVKMPVAPVAEVAKAATTVTVSEEVATSIVDVAPVKLSVEVMFDRLIERLEVLEKRIDAFESAGKEAEKKARFGISGTEVIYERTVSRL